MKQNLTFLLEPPPPFLWNHFNCSFFFGFNKTKNFRLDCKTFQEKERAQNRQSRLLRQKIPEEETWRHTSLSFSLSLSLSSSTPNMCKESPREKTHNQNKQKGGRKNTRPQSLWETQETMRRRTFVWEEAPPGTRNLQAKKIRNSSWNCYQNVADKVSEKNNNNRGPVFFFLVRDTETETRELAKEERRHKMHISRSAMDLQPEAYRRAKWKGEQKRGRKAKAGLARR